MGLTVGYNKRTKVEQTAPMVDMWESIPWGYEWRKGDPYECTADVVDHIIADGPELEYIKIYFTNLPIISPGKCIWKGEMANFIHTNLLHLTT